MKNTMEQINENFEEKPEVFRRRKNIILFGMPEGKINMI